MKLVSFVALLALLVVGGCRSSSRTVDEDDLTTSVTDTTEMYTRAVHVLVDGRDRGTVPTTIRVRRSFGTKQVTLWQAGKEIRTYEIEITTTTGGTQTLQGFWSTRTMEGDSYDVETLPKEGDDTYLIPYTPNRIKVEDRAFGLTMLISE
jgi:hypothetical protein